MWPTHYPLILINLLLCILIISTSAQTGSDCVTDSECYLQQTCNFGYCKCNIGYVKHVKYCFKIRGFGEDCQVETQCHDFRMVCESRGEENGKRCFCDKYNEWSDELKHCVPAANFTEIVKNLKEEVNWSDEIHRNGQKVFFGLVVAGLSVISIGLVCTAFCLIYGCCFRGKRQNIREDPERLRINEVASMGSPEGTYVPIPTELTSQQPSTSAAAIIMPIS